MPRARGRRRFAQRRAADKLRVMNAYEREQLLALRRWQATPPPPAARWIGKAAGPASRAVQTLMPPEALRTALHGVLSVATQVPRESALLRQAGVDSLQALREAELQTCDRLAERVRSRAATLAGGAGALFGVAGTAGLVADVPALLWLAFRTIHRVGLCYGEAQGGEAARHALIGIFALASANSEAEKADALRVLREDADNEPIEAAWRDGVERAAERELAKEAATASLNNLAMQLSRHLGWRKASGMMPIIGAVIGGSVNAWYVYDMATVARYSFQERWLRQRHPRLQIGAPIPEGRHLALKAARET